MKCPYCQATDNKVIDSRESKDGEVIRRRRHCDACDRRFTTYECVEEHVPMVVKKDGGREEFSRKKLERGIIKACEKRPVPVADIEEFVRGLERELAGEGEREVDSSYLGEQVMEYLREVDGVAYVRFASVYRRFRDVAEFKKELEHLLRDLGGSR